MVRIDEDACVACGLCAKVCPTGAIFVAFGKARVNLLACAGCGQCIEVCRTGAIHWKDEETRRKVPGRPFFRYGEPGRGRFLSGQRSFPERGSVQSNINELRQRLEDLKKKADEVVKRLEHL